MSSLSRSRAAAALFVCGLSCAAAFGQGKELRVCSDPNNLPFSNVAQEGFENRIAALVADDLNLRLTYVWQRMGRGFVREFLNKGRCDLLIGIPANFQAVLTTDPYYRSTYVFVVRRDASFKPTSLDDQTLRNVRIGVQALDEQYTPPAEALMNRGLRNSLVPFHSVGDDAETIMHAVADRQIDVAVVWGPLAGYWAQKFDGSVQCMPVRPESEPPLPFTFEIAMGVRKGDVALKEDLQKILERRRPEIQKILEQYGIPRLAIPQRKGEAD